MSLVAAVAASLCYAAAMVVQQERARVTPEAHSMRPALLGGLARDRWWRFGLAANLAGFGLRFAALRHGSLAVVQVILVTSLLVALTVSAGRRQDRLTPREWAGATAIAVGVPLFVVVAAPVAARQPSGMATWLAVFAIVAMVAGLFIGLAAGRRGPSRARLLAAAAGILLALVAALMKDAASRLGGSVLHVVRAWQPYALVIVALVGVVVVQSAFAAGPLSASLPVLMVAESLASVGLALLIGERVAGGSLAHTCEALGLLLMAGGVVLVAGSDLASGRLPAREYTVE